MKGLNKYQILTKIMIYSFILIILFFSCNKNNKIQITNESDVIIASDENIISSRNDTYDRDLKYKYYGDFLPYNILPGKYYILENGVSMRNQPSLNGEIIETLHLSYEIEIIENMGNQLFIDGVLQNWYKIKWGNSIGYIFGGSIAENVSHLFGQVDVYDIDKNGVNDYFFYRVSKTEKVHEGDILFTPKEFYSYISPDDIYIYINNKRISNQVLENKYENYQDWQNCVYYQKDDFILLDIHSYYYGIIFYIYPDGKIEFKKYFDPEP